MTQHPEVPPGSEDDLRAENEVLKLKLELDHGMNGFASKLNPKAENDWLKSVYDFEVMLKEAHGITVYDLIGRPPIRRWYTLNMGNAGAELRKVLMLLERNGITLQNLPGFDDVEFYRVITEEFLPMKFSDFSKGPFMPPVITWFGKEGR